MNFYGIFKFITKLRKPSVGAHPQPHEASKHLHTLFI